MAFTQGVSGVPILTELPHNQVRGPVVADLVFPLLLETAPQFELWDRFGLVDQHFCHQIVGMGLPIFGSIDDFEETRRRNIDFVVVPVDFTGILDVLCLDAVGLLLGLVVVESVGIFVPG